MGLRSLESFYLFHEEVDSAEDIRDGWKSSTFGLFVMD